MMSAPIQPDEVRIDHNATAASRKQQANAAVARANADNLRDDPEARAAFLSTFSAEEERSTINKVDKAFLLLIGVMFMIKQIDQTNAANVRVLQAGESRNIMKELDMTSDQYNWVGSIYGIAYIVFEAPSNLLLKRMSPHLWQSRIFLTWGIITACQAAAQNRHQLYAMRFLLGMFEAGMFPGIMAQLSSWYRTDEIGKPVTWFFAMSNLAGIIGSLLCYGISYMNGIRGISAWRWVYLLEGLATIVFSGVVFWLLPDYPKSPRSRRFLTEREQEFVEARLPENAPLTNDPDFAGKEIWAVLRTPLIWSFMLSQTLINIGGYALTWYLPTIVTNLGFVGLPRNQLLNMPPAFAAIVGLIFSAWFMSRAYIVRPAYIMILMSGMVVCFVLFFTITNRYGIYISCILGTLFYQSYFIPFWAWRSATLSGSTGTAFTLGLQSGIAQLGGVIGPQLFQSKFAYNGYKTSFAIAAATTIASFVANLWTWWLTRNTEYDVMRGEPVENVWGPRRSVNSRNFTDPKITHFGPDSTLSEGPHIPSSQPVMSASPALTQLLEKVIPQGDRSSLRSDVIPAILDAISGIAKTLQASQHVSLAGTANAFGDDQLNVDVLSENVMREAIARCPSIQTASSEEDPIEKPARPQASAGANEIPATSEEYTVAFDPLDGSSIIAPNWTVGTIVGIWDGRTAVGQSPVEKQIAAIIGVIGPRTTAIVAVRIPGADSACFEIGYGPNGVEDCEVIRSVVKLADAPFKTRYFAPANLRHAADDERYSALITRFIKEKYTLRYCGGLVPDIVHALVKGHGVYVMPVTPGVLPKLRFLYELYPIALTMECAGGQAIDPTDGRPLLEKIQKDCDGRAGLICGTTEEVRIVKQVLLG
ncbi:high-affinity nicotinic acid transporter [Colletotrichum abscissum]|nr:high-affinity nicotinic acid transporter [Colletotrichum abscissum]KAK1508761.1 high-affinity nicotinic acid transporter [Colletotrichum abscissum]